MVIDAHQHIWDPAQASYPWLTPDLHLIDRAFALDEALPLHREVGVKGCVLVEASDDPDDARLMERAADAHPEVLGIVTYSPVSDPVQLAHDLDPTTRHNRVVGVRNLIHHHPDPDWMLTEAFDEGLGILEALGLPFDVVATSSRHLRNLTTVSERHPGLRLVVDHLGKPPVGGDLGEWRKAIRTVAANPLTAAKLSGLYNESRPAAWTPDDLQPIVDHALEVFGPERLMYGGDWPISVRAGGYRRVWNGISQCLLHLRDDEREAVLFQTAADVYGLAPRAPRNAVGMDIG
ncbi:amidohydrolase [Microbacterium sp. AK031]|uniref:amidohydrolase family protein n=1 Tax=Microbacterium sp. AK031 TaxID=2723076 RepID=UPI002169F257|nr:amidohydrolase family protein [Microbacterium sp. AK031]MCS3844110.1 L-fuconolactonase [Microbacterium sp. AK031]